MYPVPTMPNGAAAGSTSHTINDKVTVVGLQLSPATLTSTSSAYFENPLP